MKTPVFSHTDFPLLTKQVSKDTLDVTQFASRVVPQWRYRDQNDHYINELSKMVIEILSAIKVRLV